MSSQQSHFLPGVPVVGNVVSGINQATHKGILGPALGAIGGSLLGPFGPILGSVLGAGLNFGLNRIEAGIQNRYNEPKATMRRLAEAGLPGAAYFTGGGNKSASSSQSYTQPDLGTSEAISREQVNRYQKQQFELMQREMALKESQQRLTNANAYKSEIWGDYMGRDSSAPQLLSNFGNMIDTQNRMRKAQQFLTEKKSWYQQAENEIYNELKKQGVQVAKEKAGLRILQEKPNIMKAQEALMSQQVQESINRINKNIVAMEAMRTQMSIAEQTMAIRKLDEMATKSMIDDINNNGGLTGMRGATYKLIFNKGWKPF